MLNMDYGKPHGKISSGQAPPSLQQMPLKIFFRGTDRTSRSGQCSQGKYSEVMQLLKNK